MAVRPYLRQSLSKASIDRGHHRHARQLEHISTDTRSLLFVPAEGVLRSSKESSYVAPEMLSGATTQATCAGDMWAFGAILFRSLFGFQREIIVAAAEESPRSHGARPGAAASGLAMPLRASSKLKINVRLQDLISKLLLVEPERRLSAEAVRLLHLNKTPRVQLTWLACFHASLSVSFSFSFSLCFISLSLPPSFPSTLPQPCLSPPPPNCLSLTPHP